MSSLYDIDKRLSNLEMYNVDDETGEYLEDEEFNKLFDEIQMDLNTKIENTLCFVKDLLADKDKIKNEIDKLEKRAKQKEHLADRLKNRIDEYIKSKYLDDENVLDVEKLNKYSFETPRIKVSYRKSNSVNILDFDKLPKEFIKKKITTTPNKVELKKYLKDNTMDCAEIVTNYNMQIN